MFEQISLTRELGGLGLGAESSSQTTALANGFRRANGYQHEITPEDVRQTLAMVSEGSISILIMDEFDRIRDTTVRATIADTIKTLSDHAIRATLVLVGVADSVTELIEQHQSTERALVQIQMPRMPNPELHEIIEKGMTALGMTMHADGKQEIVDVSLGLPHYTHLLALNAVRAAVDDHSHAVTSKHVDVATQRALEEAHQSIRAVYHDATISARKKTIFPDLLLACALATTDDLGYFAAGDLRDPLKAITGKTYRIPAFAPRLHAFCTNDRGPVLQRAGKSHRYRYRFINPLMQPYIVMQGKAKGLIPKGRAKLPLPLVED